MAAVHPKVAKKLVIGICARSKKANGKPMKQILAKLNEFYGESIETYIFSEETIFHDRIEKWPLCDVLISFYSDGFPLYKAIEYAILREIWCLNDIDKQFDLLNRATIYSTLKARSVPVPRHEVLWRNHAYHPNGTLEEHDDHIVVNGVKFTKPFVEKPVCSEDHNIRMYYPPLDGGGSQQLFRKKGNISSSYSKEASVRKDGSYIYEDFLKTGGTDVKIYAVGPDYAHAEARKSPGLDGKVDRDSDGKEARFPVILNQMEKLIARKIVEAFNQTVCGFDLLRSNGKSYVCDVNGFSFVKKSMKYYEDAAQILGYTILRKLRSETNLQLEYQLPMNPQVSPSTDGKVKELRCVIAVLRHGDRTPKQKVKMEVRDSRFEVLFKKKCGSKNKAKLKRPEELQEVLNVTRAILKDIEARKKGIFEEQIRLEQVKMALERYTFTGINRKIQFRYESKTNEDFNETKQLMLIVKWGGELTEAGTMQAERLGRAFQSLYKGRERYNTSEEQGFLRLHNTYRHDLKIYSSDEGRVKMTAAAFAKGLLSLEGGLPSILMQLIESNSRESILGDDKEERPYQNDSRRFLIKSLQVNRDLTEADIKAINPTNDKSILKALKAINNPKVMCAKLSQQIDKLCSTIELRCITEKSKLLYSEETWPLVYNRWKKLGKDFKTVDEKGEIQYDIMKIPAIYDSIKFDIEHNFGAFNIKEMNDIFTNAKLMADVVVPQQFGVTKDEKIFIGRQICSPLIKKIFSDVKQCLDPEASTEIHNPYRHLRSRIYFTSESHIHPLMNLIRFDLLSELVILLYEDPTVELRSGKRIHVEIHFSSGTMTYLQTDHIPLLGYRPRSTSTTSESDSPDDEESEEDEGKDPKSASSSVETEVVEFAQKTLNFMNKEKNRFVSDQVITDIMASKLEDKPFGAPALMTTAIIGCNSTQKTANINELKILNLAYFVPPIRSLETLHNQMPFQNFLDFIDRNSCSDVDCSKTDPSNTAT